MGKLLDYGAKVLVVVIGVWVATSFDNPVAGLVKKVS